MQGLSPWVNKGYEEEDQFEGFVASEGIHLKNWNLSNLHLIPQSITSKSVVSSRKAIEGKRNKKLFKRYSGKSGQPLNQFGKDSQRFKNKSFKEGKNIKNRAQSAKSKGVHKVNLSNQKTNLQKPTDHIRPEVDLQLTQDLEEFIEKTQEGDSKQRFHKAPKPTQKIFSSLDLNTIDSIYPQSISKIACITTDRVLNKLKNYKKENMKLKISDKSITKMKSRPMSSKQQANFGKHGDKKENRTKMDLFIGGSVFVRNKNYVGKQFGTFRF